MQQSVSTLSEYILSNYDPQFSSANKFLLRGISFTQNKFEKDFEKEFDSDPEIHKVLKNYSYNEKRTFFVYLFGSLLEGIKRAKQCAGVKSAHIENLAQVQFEDIVLIKDKFNTMYLYNEKTQVVDTSKPDPTKGGARKKTDSVVSAYLASLDQDQAAMTIATAPMYHVEYHPLQFKRFFNRENPKTKQLEGVINTCDHPSWFHVVPENRPLVTEIPPNINTLLDCLAEREAKHNILSWIKHMVLSRAQSILVLATEERGAGKGLFVDILAALLGESNAERGNVKLYDKEFNLAMANNRLLNKDEVSVPDPFHNRVIKEYSNDRITIEPKGRDPYETDNYCSIVFTTNEITNIFIHRSDRRFFIPDLPDRKLSTFLNSKAAARKLGILISSLKKPGLYPQEYALIIKEVEDFFYYLCNYDTKDFNCEEPPAGKLYDTAVLASLSPWENIIRDLIVSRKDKEYIYNVNKLFGGNSRPSKYDRGGKPKNPESVKRWLKNYVEADGRGLGEMIHVVEDVQGSSKMIYKIIPTPQYMPESQESLSPKKPVKISTPTKPTAAASTPAFSWSDDDNDTPSGNIVRYH